MATTMHNWLLQALALLGLLLGAAGTSQAQTVVYYHTDALGSPVAVTDAGGVVLERREYEPYGRQLTPMLQDGPGYTGHVSDAVTGLSYMQQRYYDPGIGAFLSVDPVSVDGTTGWNFCRYCYAANNPYKFKDPDGRSIWTKLIKLALNGGNVAQTVAGVVDDAKTVMNPNASAGQRIIAGVSLASEALPISVGDVKDGAKVANAVADKVGDVVRTHADLVRDFKKNPGDWTRTAAQGRSTPLGSNKSGANVESVWQNDKTGERLYSHEAYNPKTGESIHPENQSQNLPDGGALRRDPKWEDRLNK